MVATAKLTYEDYAAIPDDGRRYEIVDGELYVTPTPIVRHQAVLCDLLCEVYGFLKKHRIGQVYIARLDVVLSDFDVVEPDLIYVRNERADIIKPENIRGTPDLLVEILGEFTRRHDEITKRNLYDRFGVAEYWIVDPEIDLVKVYRRGETGRLERVAELTAEANDKLISPLFPGLEIDLVRVFSAQ